MPAPRDITGMVFNHLKAVEKAPSRGGHTYWKFKCDCGNEKEIQTFHVTSGLIENCGCMFDPIKNLMGGRLQDDPNARVCVICDSQFFGLVGDARIYCYECSPRGASVADAHKAQKRAMKRLLVEYKGGKCVECDYDKCEGSLQLHHLDGKDKDLTFSHIKPNQVTMTKLYQEADKCILLCANCHAKKHVVDDVVGVVMNLSNEHSKFTRVKKCKICEVEFETDSAKRCYCYNCSPKTTITKMRVRSIYRAVKHELLNYKGGAVCVSCGYNEYEGALHFHHRNPEEKEFTFSQAPLNNTDFTMERLKREADKCDVLCANCHFEVHYKNGDDEIDLD